MKPVTYIIEIVPEVKRYKFTKTGKLATGVEKTTESHYYSEKDLIDVAIIELRERKKAWKSEMKKSNTWHNNCKGYK